MTSYDNWKTTDPADKWGDVPERDDEADAIDSFEAGVITEDELLDALLRIGRIEFKSAGAKRKSQSW